MAVAMLRALLLTFLLALTALTFVPMASADFVCAVEQGRTNAVCYDDDRHYFCTLQSANGDTLCLQHVNFQDFWCPFEKPILQCVI